MGLETPQNTLRLQGCDSESQRFVWPNAIFVIATLRFYCDFCGKSLRLRNCDCQSLAICFLRLRGSLSTQQDASFISSTMRSLWYWGSSIVVGICLISRCAALTLERAAYSRHASDPSRESMPAFDVAVVNKTSARGVQHTCCMCDSLWVVTWHLTAPQKFRSGRTDPVQFTILSKSLRAWNYYFRIFRGLQLQLSGVFRIN